jgi:hypothetical protein
LPDKRFVQVLLCAREDGRANVESRGRDQPESISLPEDKRPFRMRLPEPACLEKIDADELETTS